MKRQILYTITIIMLTIFVMSWVNLLFYNYLKNQQTYNVSNEVVLKTITEQKFLVVKTVVSDVETTINIDQWSDWSNFWWWKIIVAKWRVRTDVWVDFNNVWLDDITIDNKSKTITIDIDWASILDSSVESDLEIKTSGSIIRKILSDERNKDYQMASRELIKTWSELINADFKIQKDIINSAENFLSLIYLRDWYKVVLK